MIILIGLVILDLVVIGIVMYFVMNEKQEQHTEPHPFVVEARRAASDAADAGVVAKTEEKTES